MNILHIDSSVLGTQSVSRQLTAQVVAHLKHHYPAATFTYRDVTADPINPLTGEMLASRFIAREQWNKLQQEEEALTEVLLGELFAADILVIGAPMYNFSVPVQLKNWIDRVLVAGRTFKYTPQGAIGLLENKKVVFVSSRGGVHSQTEAEQKTDFQEDYLRAVLKFIGITDISIIRAEGLHMSPDNRENALKIATASIRQLAL